MMNFDLHDKFKRAFQGHRQGILCLLSWYTLVWVWLAFGCAGESNAQEENKKEARVIQGTVRDHLGRPVVNATVEWGVFRTKENRETTTTNMHGAFELAVKNVGKDYRVGVYAKGHAPDWIDGLTPQAGKPVTVNFKLKESRFIEGTVYSKSTNTPIVNATVSAQTVAYGFLSSFSNPIPPTPFPGPPRVVKTDKNGKFRLDDLRDTGSTQKKDMITLKVVAAGFRQHLGDVQLTDVKLKDPVSIYLVGEKTKKSGMIRVQLVDQKTGLPISKYTVGKRYSTAAQRVHSKTGTYEEKQVTVGNNYSRMFFAVGYEPQKATLKARELGEMTVTRIKLKKHRPIKGRIVDETGKPIAGVKIVCAISGRYFPWDAFDKVHDGFHPMKMVQRGVTDRNGYFEFADGANPNHLYVFPLTSHARKIIRPAERGKRDSSGRITIQLAKASTISGHYSRGEELLAGSQVRLWKHQTTKPEENWETVVANKNGEYEFDHLEEGTYSISGYATRQFKVRKGEQLEIDLGGDLGPHTLTGKAVPFLRIFLRPQIKDWDYTQFETKADADGNYSFNGLKAGSYGVYLMYFSESAGTFLDAQASIKIDGNKKHDFKQFQAFAK